MKSHKLESPQAMRALAHPLRLRILGELRRQGAATITQLAAALDSSTASVSYHTQQLARHDFVEPAPDKARNRKERWWRATADQTTWSLESFGDQEQHAANAALVREMLQLHVASLEEYQRSAAEWGADWAAVSGPRDYAMRLSPQDMDQMLTEIEQVIGRWQSKPAADPQTAARASLIMYSFPRH
ncbi:ArsR/SmtB family transcription factor [Streptomyces cyaneofuscatus]|uniref:ArsR/SmtB family transcription factor n=1 Tax=Streptomyces cyaneofuscatus TaxID=66883 RepID=UPI00341DC464